MLWKKEQPGNGMGLMLILVFSSIYTCYCATRPRNQKSCLLKGFAVRVATLTNLLVFLKYFRGKKYWKVLGENSDRCICNPFCKQVQIIRVILLHQFFLFCRLFSDSGKYWVVTLKHFLLNKWIMLVTDNLLHSLPPTSITFFLWCTTCVGGLWLISQVKVTERACCPQNHMF